MFTDDNVEKETTKELTTQKELDLDNLALGFDKAHLNVFLIIQLADGALTQQQVVTQLYDSAIAYGLWQLGNEALVAAETTKHISLSKETEKFFDALHENPIEIIDLLFYRYKNIVKSKEELRKFLENYTIEALGAAAMYRIYKDNLGITPNTPLEKISNVSLEEVGKNTHIIADILTKHAKERKQKVSALDRIKAVSLLNSIFEYQVPSNKSVGGILENLYIDNGLIIESIGKLSKRGKRTWQKEKQITKLWNTRKNEVFQFFNMELKNISSKPCIKDLLVAYDKTVINFFGSEKFVEFFALPILVSSLYPVFPFVFDLNKVYSEFTFYSLMPTNIKEQLHL